MDEKKLVESKQGKITKYVSLAILIVGVVAFAMIWPDMSSPYSSYNGKSLNYILTSMVPYFGSMTLLPAIIISALLFFGTSRCNMTITDKRVYGKAAFGKRVDLPLDSVSAVGTGIFNSLAVATSSGKIQFFDIINKDEMYQILSNLLIERQKNNMDEPVIKQEVQQSNADELKKFKDLFDSGVITQEEFDEKKKQLLGL